MIAPETEAMFVERFLQREATSKQTIRLKAEEKERGHDWVVPTDVVGCTEIIAVCREIAWLREDLISARQDLANTLRRANKAEAALAEALKVIEPLAELSHLGDPRYDYDTLSADTVIMARLEDLRAASAFAAKHGGRDG